METEDRSGLSDGHAPLAQSSLSVATQAGRYLDRVASGKVKRLSFGLGKAVDDETGGLEDENLIIVAGETKAGKTVTAVNIAYANIKSGVRTLVITTEVSATSYILRLVTRDTAVPLSVMRVPLGSGDRKAVDESLALFGQRPLYIADQPLCTLDDIGRSILEADPELVIIDHLQRIQYSGDNPALGFKNVALKLKNYSVKLGIPIVLLSQVTFGEGWCETLSDGTVQYRAERMTTRWSKEPVMEADKVLVLHNRGQHSLAHRGQANLIVHSMRDYSSGGVLPLIIKPEAQWLGDYDMFRQEFSDGPS